jgi:hypothetical protein
MVAIRRLALEENKTVRRGNLAMLRSDAQIFFYLLNKSLAADRD